MAMTDTNKNMFASTLEQFLLCGFAKFVRMHEMFT